jgi:hypothetical protein
MIRRRTAKQISVVGRLICSNVSDLFVELYSWPQWSHLFSLSHENWYKKSRALQALLVADPLLLLPHHLPENRSRQRNAIAYGIR